jgi:hypothetical protein
MVEAAGIEPVTTGYRNLVMACDFRILTLPMNDLRSRVECSAVLPSHGDIWETASPWGVRTPPSLARVSAGRGIESLSRFHNP